MPDIEIRPARLGDEVSLQANCKAAVSVDQVRRQLEWTTRERGPHTLEHFVAVDGIEVVGTVMLWPRGGHAVERPDGSYTLCRGRNGAVLDIARLDDWSVTSTYAGQGLGSRLAAAVMDKARSWGVGRLESSSANPAAVRSLERLGFRPWGRFPLGDEAYEVFLVVEL